MIFVYLLLILSAFCYSFAFIFIDKLWYLIFIFITPISYIMLSSNLSNKLLAKAFLYGFTWGLIAFTLQPIGLYISLIDITQGYRTLIIFMVFLLIIYQALYSGFWFYLSYKIIHNIENPIIRFLIFTAISCLYFYFLEHYILWPFTMQKVEGLCLLSPILPLTIKPELLYLVTFIDKIIFLFILILSSSLLSLIFIYKNLLAKILIFAISIFPFVLSILFSNKIAYKNFTNFFDKIAAISKAFHNPGNNKKTAIEINNEIKKVKAINNNIEIVLFPESSFYLCDLKNESELTKHFDKDIHIIIGAIRKKNGNYYNTLYHIYNSKIVNKFYKRHALIITERLLNFNFLNKILLSSYFKSRPIITQSKKKRIGFNTIDNIKLIPYICSEIFFNDQPDDNFDKDSIIVCLCNDSWINQSVSYIQKLMLLVNKFKAIYWQRYIIYVDYKSAYVFNKFGIQKGLLNKIN